MIQFKNYKKYFGSQLIADIPLLELEHHIYWLQGDNGSGKTTLIKSIAGLIPFDGTISVAGADIRKQRMAYRNIVNYAEAEPAYPGFLTGMDLIRFYAKAKNAADNQAAALISSFGIGSYADNKIATYSSGMTKKLSLVLAFIGNPKLMLLDEPLITLDVQSVSNLQRIIGDCYRTGVTFIITSHQELINGLAARLPKGATTKEGTTAVTHQFGKLIFNRLT
jgi:ABC-2 type transport system ATP-binding protein